jgi:hypothetical protein
MKTDTEVQYHVTLRHPGSVKLADRRETFHAFDAVFDSESSPVMPDAFEFRTHTLYRESGGQSPIVMRVTLHVPATNIATIIPQPFKDRS